MQHRFNKHYTREEARALLPQIRRWLDQLLDLGVDLEKAERRLSGLTSDRMDTGGKLVNDWVRTLTKLRGILKEFQSREIVIKDLERGLIDFPALIGGREVFLCWEKDEDDIEFWHDLDSGYAGREPL
jgi:hypothetical protein